MAMIPMKITHKYNRDQFHGYLKDYFGESEDPVVYRGMSDEEYRGGLEKGYLKSNYEPDLEEGEFEYFPAGTYAAEDIPTDYIDKGSRIAQIKKTKDWFVDDNRPGRRTFLNEGKIPMEDVMKVSPVIDAHRKSGTYIVKEQR